MRKLILALFLGVVCVASVSAQQATNDSPASKEDIERYLEVMHARDMMTKMVDAMSKPMHQMIHEQFEKDKAKLPPDFEARMDKMLDDEMKSFPWGEMLDAMVPVYQKHLTKGDVTALIAFYNSPTGQKVLREMPEVMQEAMEAVMPIMRRQMEAMTQRMQQEVAEMIKESGAKADQKSQASPD